MENRCRFIASCSFGVFLGMVMGFSKILREAIYPLLVGFNAIPKATVVPIIALMFVGQHDLNTVLIAFMISFFPIAVSVSIGLSTLEPEYRDILRSLGASKSTIFGKLHYQRLFRFLEHLRSLLRLRLLAQI